MKVNNDMQVVFTAAKTFARIKCQACNKGSVWTCTGHSCRNMISAIIKRGSARDLKVDGCGDKGFRQVQAFSMRGNTLLLFGDLNPPSAY